MHALEKGMAAHSSVLAWTIPGTEPGGPSMGSHRIRQDWSDLACMHALEKRMAAHSSVLSWTIPGTEEPGGLPSMGSHRVGHDWSDLACMHALEKGMAAHSSVLAWRIPGTEEPARLPSMGSHRVGTGLKGLSSSSSSLQWQVSWSQSLDPSSLCCREIHKHSTVAEVALISLLHFLVTPQILGDMKMLSSSEPARSWLTFTGCLNGNWSPCSVSTGSIRCHPFHRWELWGTRLPSCRTEFWSGWATSENPFLSFHHCLPSLFLEGNIQERTWLWDS